MNRKRLFKFVFAICVQIRCLSIISANRVRLAMDVLHSVMHTNETANKCGFSQMIYIQFVSFLFAQCVQMAHFVWHYFVIAFDRSPLTISRCAFSTLHLHTRLPVFRKCSTLSNCQSRSRFKWFTYYAMDCVRRITHAVHAKDVTISNVNVMRWCHRII